MDLGLVGHFECALADHERFGAEIDRSNFSVIRIALAFAIGEPLASGVAAVVFFSLAGALAGAPRMRAAAQSKEGMGSFIFI